jgi:transposase
MIPIELDLPHVKVLGVKRSAEGDYEIEVESTQEHAKCHRCGQIITAYHDQSDQWVRLRHLPILGRKVYVCLRPKRYRCPYCSSEKQQVISTQRVSWYTPRSGFTKAYEQQLLVALVNSTLQDVSVREAVGYKALEGLLDRYLDQQVEWAEIPPLETIGIDEIARRKGHRDFVPVIVGRTTSGELVILGVLENRLKDTVKAFLRQIPPRLVRTLKAICTDLYEGYLGAVKEVLPQVTVVVDRFHVARLYRESVDQLRRQEMKRLKRDLPAEAYQALQGLLWPFRKNQADLTPEESDRLALLFGHSPALKQAYDLREQLTAIFNDTTLSKAQALDALDDWYVDACNSRLACFDSFLTTLAETIELIANYFHQRHSSGFVEGFNNKLKVLKRRCYGILNRGHLFQRLCLDLEGYRRFAPT